MSSHGLTNTQISLLSQSTHLWRAGGSKARDCKLYPAVPEAPEAPEDQQNPEAPEDPKDEDLEIPKYPEDRLDYL